MTHDYLRVVPTSANLEPDSITTAIESLHKLYGEESGGPASRLNSFRSGDPPTFEFVVISEDKDEPVEFYYGADSHLEVLQQRLRSTYPDSFDIDHVEVDILEKLIQPVEYRPREFNERVEAGGCFVLTRSIRYRSSMCRSTRMAGRFRRGRRSRRSPHSECIGAEVSTGGRTG